MWGGPSHAITRHSVAKPSLDTDCCPPTNTDQQQQPAGGHLVSRPTLKSFPPRHTASSPDSTPRRNKSLPLTRLSVSSRKGLFSANT